MEISKNTVGGGGNVFLMFFFTKLVGCLMFWLVCNNFANV